VDPVLKDIASNVLPMVMGGIGTGFVWLAKAMWRAKKDLDFAHEKIRSIEKELKSKGLHT